MKHLRQSHMWGAIAVGATLVLALAAPVSAAGHQRPFVGRTAGEGSLGPAIPDCPAGSMFHVEGADTGNVTHLGRVTETYHQCAAVNWATGEGWLTENGSLTMTAANGDLLFLSYDGQFVATPLPVPTTATGEGNWVITGGTGRFAGATGSGTMSMSVQYTPDLTGAAVSWTWVGSITY